MKILILNSNHKNRATRRIIKESEKRGHSVTVLNPTQLYLYLSNSDRGYDKVYDGYSSILKAINDRSYDALINRITKTSYTSFIVEHFEKNLNIYTTASAEGLRVASDKFNTQLKASINGIKVPKTILFDDDKHLDSLVEKIGGYPVILKTRYGSQGKGVNLIKDKNTLTSFVQTIDRFNPKLILQEYIENTEDYRAIVIGNKVVASMKRSSNKRNEFRANITLGGIAENIELTDEEKAFCIRSAKALNLDFAGVDFMKQGKNIVLIEVNGNPGFKIERITGINIAEALIKHIEVEYSNNTPAFNGLIPTHPYDDIMRLSKSIKEYKNDLEFYTEHKVIIDAYSRFKGETVEYTDKDNQELKLKVSSKKDIYKIIFDTIKLY